MFRSLIAFVFLQSLLAPLLALPVYAEGYARVAVAVADKQDNEQPLTETSLPMSGERLNMYFDTNRECVVLVVPLTVTEQRVANGWRPQLVALSEWKEQKLPQSPVVWNWPRNSKEFEFWVFFFKSEAAGLDEIRDLVRAMRSPELGHKVLAQQSRQLREILGPRMMGKVQVVHGPKANANPSGGAVRADEFPWRDFAHRVELNDAGEGLVVIRHGQ